MSTTFGLFRKMDIKTDEHGCITSDYAEDDYIRIARRVNRGIHWTHPYEILADYLPDSVPVYPLDNSAQGIYTVGDIKKTIKQQKTVKSESPQ